MFFVRVSLSLENQNEWDVKFLTKLCEISGTDDDSKIKTQEVPCKRQVWDPKVELMLLGWIIRCPGLEEAILACFENHNQ